MIYVESFPLGRVFISLLSKENNAYRKIPASPDCIISIQNKSRLTDLAFPQKRFPVSLGQDRTAAIQDKRSRHEPRSVSR